MIGFTGLYFMPPIVELQKKFDEFDPSEIPSVPFSQMGKQ